MENAEFMSEAASGQATAGLHPLPNPALFRDVVAENGPKPLRFLFPYGKLPVTGELRLGDGIAELRLFVVVGQLPYSVESRERRRSLREVIKAFTAELGDAVVVSPEQLICVSGAASIAEPLTPCSLVTALVTTLFRVRPVLESLACVLPDLGPAVHVPGSGKGAEAEAPQAC